MVTRHPTAAVGAGSGARHWPLRGASPLGRVCAGAHGPSAAHRRECLPLEAHRLGLRSLVVIHPPVTPPPGCEAPHRTALHWERHSAYATGGHAARACGQGSRGAVGQGAPLRDFRHFVGQPQGPRRGRVGERTSRRGRVRAARAEHPSDGAVTVATARRRPPPARVRPGMDRRAELHLLSP